MLFIIALLAAGSMPAIQSTFVERALRNDSHRLALMVKTGMLQSSEQHRVYVIDISATTMALHPLDENTDDADPAPPATDTADSDQSPAQENFDTSIQLDSANKILAPDRDKPKVWVPLPATHWFFRPGELCPVPRVRLTRGEAWLEMSFNALTGNVEDETYTFP